MAPSGSILSCFGRKKEQQEEPQTSNRLNKPFRSLKQFCCIGKIPTQSSDPIIQSSNPIFQSANIELSASANIEPSASENIEASASENIELSASANIEPSASENIEPSASANIELSASANIEPSASADDPAHLIHPYGPEIVANRENSVIRLPNGRGFPNFTDPEIASLLSSQFWRVLGENVPNELGIIRSTLFNFGSSFLRLFYMAGLVPPERERGCRAVLLDTNGMRWRVRLRNLPPRGIGVDYENFAILYDLIAQDYVYLMETASPNRMMLVFMRRNSMTNSLAAWLVPCFEVGFPSFAPP